MTTKKTKWAAYIRVSKKGKREGRSYMTKDQQRTIIDRWLAEHRGIEVVAWYEDEDQSGGTISRKAFNQLIDRCQSDEIRGIIVARVNRFARVTAKALTLIEELALEHGVDVRAAEGNVDTTTKEGRKQLRDFLSMAEYELDSIREGWKDAARRAIDDGVYVGNSQHFGYSKDEEGRLHRVESEAKIVHEAFERRAQRQTLQQIATWLDQVAPRDGKHWTNQTVKSMLRAKLYLGWSSRGDYVNKEAWEPIVTEPLFNAANSINGGPGALSNDHPPLLGGLIRCSGCGYGMRRVWSASGKDKKIEAYICPKNHTYGTCPDPAYITAADVETAVMNLFMRFHAASAGSLRHRVSLNSNRLRINSTIWSAAMPTC